jgi:hypothetical protein
VYILSLYDLGTYAFGARHFSETLTLTLSLRIKGEGY